MKNFLLIFSILLTLACQAHAQSTATLCVGATITLTGATTGGTWTSSNTLIASVGSSTGIVTGVSPGTATLGYATSSVITITSVTVNPIPSLSSSLTPPTICDSEVFDYTPESTAAGTLFTWSQAYIPGIAPPGASGTGNPDEPLTNSTYVPVPVVFTYTLSANGCTNTQNVTVTVDPTPYLSSTLTPPAICDTDTFIYTATSVTPGTIFDWNRPAITGISPGTNFGEGNIRELLHNTTASAITVSYLYRLGAPCLNLGYQIVNVIVEPCSSLTVNNISTSENEIKIYPNPAHSSFTLELPGNASQATITISNILGKIIQTKIIEAGAASKQIINLNNIPAGSYFIKASVNDQVYRQKLVIW